ncbi:MAG: phosphomethylpyrimidine synthase ThiC, partial [Thermodesulfobacteriota bacterium]
MKVIHKTERIPDLNVITRDPFPRSRKIYVKGKLHDVKVAMREIEVDDRDLIFSNNGELKGQFSLAVYDTSGPYTDPHIEIDIHSGLPHLRDQWILDRGDVERLNDYSSEFVRKNHRSSKIKGIRFKNIRKPLRARHGKNVTQMHYAR